MPGEHVDYFTCSCGAMRLDPDAGRFGSSLGDLNILVYRKINRPWLGEQPDRPWLPAEADPPTPDEIS